MDSRTDSQYEREQQKEILRRHKWWGNPYLLQVQPESLETGHGGYKLLLVPLDALDGYDALGELVGLLLLGGLGAGGLLLGVLRGALLGLEGERGCRGFKSLCLGC